MCNFVGICFSFIFNSCLCICSHADADFRAFNSERDWEQFHKDAKIGDFEMPWETNNVRARGQFRDKYASSADTWAIEPQGINQVGCIFSIQGFEIDYIGVILGPDIQYNVEKLQRQQVSGRN